MEDSRYRLGDEIYIGKYVGGNSFKSGLETDKYGRNIGNGVTIGKIVGKTNSSLHIKLLKKTFTIRFESSGKRFISMVGFKNLINCI